MFLYRLAGRFSVASPTLQTFKIVLLCGRRALLSISTVSRKYRNAICFNPIFWWFPVHFCINFIRFSASVLVFVCNFVLFPFGTYFAFILIPLYAFRSTLDFLLTTLCLHCASSAHHSGPFCFPFGTTLAPLRLLWLPSAILLAPPVGSTLVAFHQSLHTNRLRAAFGGRRAWFHFTACNYQFVASWFNFWSMGATFRVRHFIVYAFGCENITVGVLIFVDAFRELQTAWNNEELSAINKAFGTSLLWVTYFNIFLWIMPWLPWNAMGWRIWQFTACSINRRN